MSLKLTSRIMNNIFISKINLIEIFILKNVDLLMMSK